METELLTLKEAAEFIERTTHIVHYHMRKGELSPIRVPTQGRGGTGYEWRFSRTELEQLIASRDIREIPPYEFSPSREDCAYMAGLVDGEGTIIIRHKNHRQYGILVAVYNTYGPVLEWCADTFGCAAGRVYRFNINSRHTAGYAWRADSFRAYHVLKAVLPWLRIKREQALIAIEFQEALTSRRRHRWRPITQEDLEWREQQRLRLQELNRSRYYKLGPSSE